MKPPIESNTPAEELSADARALLRSARRPRVRTDAERARTNARVASIVAVGASMTLFKVVALAASLAVAGTVATSVWIARRARTSTEGHAPSTRAIRRGNEAIAIPARAPTDTQLVVPETVVPMAAVDASPPTVTPVTSLPPVTQAVRSADTSESSLESERVLLDRAQQLVTRDPAAALALTRLHAQRFRRPMLATEAAVLSIEALARLGRAQPCRQRAESFLRLHPDGIHAERVRAFLLQCGGTP